MSDVTMLGVICLGLCGYVLFLRFVNKKLVRAIAMMAFTMNRVADKEVIVIRSAEGDVTIKEAKGGA